MKWKIFFLAFLRNVILWIILGAIALGLFGFLLAGKVGAINGAYWGAIFGLLGGSFSGMALLVRFWEQPGNYQMIPEYSWFIKKEEESTPKD